METGRRIDVLDGWRGVSIILVLIGHFFSISSFNLGAWGVEWFFVLSGRLMADILFVRQAPLKEFYRRRVNRILPLVIVFVPTMYLIFYSTELHFKIIAGLAAITFTINYVFVIVDHQLPVIAHLWSLCVEEHAYILLGILAIIVRKFTFSVIPILTLTAFLSVLDFLVCSNIPHKNFFHVLWRTDAHVYSILFGCILYLVSIKVRAIPKWIPLLSIIIALLSKLIFINNSDYELSVLSTLMLAISVSNLEFSFRFLTIFFNNCVLRRLGVLSFSIYIWQQPFYVLSHSESLPFRLTMFIAAVLTGVTSYYLIEDPARRFFNRFRFSEFKWRNYRQRAA